MFCDICNRSVLNNAAEFSSDNAANYVLQALLRRLTVLMKIESDNEDVNQIVRPGHNGYTVLFLPIFNSYFLFFRLFSCLTNWY